MRIQRKNILILIILILILVFAAGCGREGTVPGEGDAQNGEQREVTIVTSFYPVYIATINVARDIPGVIVKNMTEPQTGCLHDYSLKPADIRTLENADVFIINGAGMEMFIDDVIKQQKNLPVIEASAGIQLLKNGSGEDNPHVWVSITNAITYVENIAAGLAAIDPGNGDNYRLNAANYTEKLKDLKNSMHDAIDDLPNKDIVTFHEAFPYFAQEFNIRIAAVVEDEPGREPSAKELSVIIDTINKEGVKALFAEPQYSSRIVEAIARDTGAKLYTLDPVVTGEAGSDAYNAYIEAMEANKRVLQEALQ